MGYYILYTVAASDGTISYCKFTRSENNILTAVCTLGFWLLRNARIENVSIWAIISSEVWEEHKLDGGYLPNHIPQELVGNCEEYNELIQLIHTEINYTIGEVKSNIIELIQKTEI